MITPIFTLECNLKFFAILEICKQRQEKQKKEKKKLTSDLTIQGWFNRTIRFKKCMKHINVVFHALSGIM